MVVATRSNQARCTRLVAPTLLALASVAMMACVPKPKPGLSPGQLIGPARDGDARRAEDQGLVDLEEKMRLRAEQSPGNAAAAGDFAFELTRLYRQGVVERREISPALLDEALGCLGRARAANPSDGPVLLAREGELRLAAGQTEAGLGALRESLADKPTLWAFKPLIHHYEAEKLDEEARALCEKTLPAMRLDSDRYLVLDRCLEASGAATPETGLRWAGAREIQFYKARRHEIDVHRVAPARKQRRGSSRRAADRTDTGGSSSWSSRGGKRRLAAIRRGPGRVAQRA